MAKTITLSYNGEDYTLEYTRKSIETMEKRGFNIREVASKPMSTLPDLFAGAFLAHHRWVKQDVIDSIFERIPNKEDFLEKLTEMYSEPVEVLFSEPESTEGNASWKASW